MTNILTTVEKIRIAETMQKANIPALHVFEVLEIIEFYCKKKQREVLKKVSINAGGGDLNGPVVKSRIRSELKKL